VRSSIGAIHMHHTLLYVRFGPCETTHGVTEPGESLGGHTSLFLLDGLFAFVAGGMALETLRKTVA
jgi:hypothetical protein